jgi:hypothetical protein
MSRHHLRTLLTSLGLGVLLSLAAPPVPASVVGFTSFLRPEYPDFSQMAADNSFAPLSGHPSWWGDPAVPGTCAMCGPTTAAAAAFWFAGQAGPWGRSSQVQSGADWVNATAGNIIEQFALAVGVYEGWDPRAGPFPGTSDDQNYIRGQSDFYAARGIEARFDHLHVTTASFEQFFDRLAGGLIAGRAVELSNEGHWFSVAGVRTDLFEDRNANGDFDAGDDWVLDHDGDGAFDRYLWINNPWPGHASEGWVDFYAAGGSYYLRGDSRALDSAVFVSLVPTPSTLLLVMVAGAAPALRRRALRRSA